jgi:hypothetical protein
VAIAAAAGFVRGDREWLAVTIGIAFLSTPILWPHYLLLLFVPIALARRRLAGLWLAPLLLWFDATARSGGSPVRIGAILLFAAVILAIAKENGHSPTLILRHARERRDSKGWSTSHASWDSSPQ